ncbi:zinc finger protein STAR3 [Brachypodium distachyon]|uniref:C2H2-type domain-containing protein n=1 Tax=Brachypodium distachyon TaxID=15368 RepID=I1GL41_BRADI|nr:zinc finger protein STAR3 [Brachypodium distachyon]KQK12241.1 hypothetical protein BRADI_1g02410v3 [Brachypodium distachyon]|eukprot:XP_003559181.1 zinc finger protein STAR3 [Brachypodium distachyon]
MEAWDVRNGTGHGGGNGRGAEAEDGRSASASAAALTTYLAFLEHKIGHLRGIICSPAPSLPQQQQVVSAELACIISQLASIANDLATDAGTPSSPASSPSAGTPNAHAVDDEQQQEPVGSSSSPPAYEVIELDKEEILAPPHAHSCKLCGKGFKRDANLRMHMRAHGHSYNHKKEVNVSPPPAPETKTKKRPAPAVCYSCPQAGCKRNRAHASFAPLKTAVCVRNHYRRTHCAKTHACRRCGGVKRFAVLADLRTHEKHCGRDRWVCSCTVSFSRRDKLLAHVALFPAGAGHSPALPLLPDETAAAQCSTGNNDTANGGGGRVTGSGELLPGTGTGGGDMMDQSFLSDIGMLDDFGCSDVKGSIREDDGRRRGSLSPAGLDFCDFDGFDLFGTHAMNFDF